MSIGEPLPRPDGRDKVTGRARYAADQEVAGLLHAALVGAPTPSGTVTAIDGREALATAGVARVLTAADMPRFGPVSPPSAVSKLPMQDGTIRHEGQPVAIVLAETLEAAECGAGLVRLMIEPAPFRPQGGGEVAVPPGIYGPVTFTKGDPDAAFLAAEHQHIAEYRQPSRHHNPIEPSATIAVWEGENLTLYDSVQHGYSVQAIVAAALNIRPERVRVISPHTGGGFGAKGFVWPHEILTAAAARVAGRPVKLVLSRAQMYANVGFQPNMVHRMALGAGRNGRLTAIKHEVEHVTALSDDFVEMATAASRGTYASPAIFTAQKVERANVNMPTAMRAPWEGPGLWGLESAIDELAHAVGQDPLDFRLANYAETDPATGKPWSSKKLREAYEEGARLFGWRERAGRPKRDGPWTLGFGMATCSMGAFRFPSQAQVRIKADGSVTVETGCHDIGTGTLTIFPQIAADVLGLPPDEVELIMGDTRLPQGGPTYGSSSTMGVGASVLRAAENARELLGRLANLPAGEVVMKDGRIGRRGGLGAGVPIGDALRTAGVGEVVGKGRFTLPGDAPFNADGEGTPHTIRTFGAVFIEVGVDCELGLLRLRRAVGSYSAGRVINPRTARAQMTGGIIWGWGMAAMEASPYEKKLGRWLSKNLAGVAIPVNADIPSDIQIHFVDEFDPHASPLGAKGIGELGATGVAAAVASAVFDATGKRIRELPITPGKLV
ncbi:MAG: xanthine dehydrogenase family protein molybdopterin-binding subunit [Methylobacteriaceae bacterium]|nr:xanthine dehydrogenase family protein molybdopterin-binding subunit [Methylobacteriaceae bacterium]